ncbi:DUF2141 domain-containing protein [Tropicibacter sp. R16_0]|uniref:DUF2141 domain-containing protein n=1 Tax=Tropicibacter sp. R16_0 TaxID=2821102 RepID=UPI001ADB2F24|nr:DUF2141 domain-containing protein [Tropicibacter sp. R16_0]MBO9450395.1 DUF2141 domain-containing protein [Tropicibacter sp. R16_0]
MPSNAMRLFGLVATTGMFVAGAWLAQEASSPETLAAVLEADREYYESQDKVPPSQQITGPLSVTLEGIRNAKGKVLVLAYDDKTAYENSDPEKVAGFIEASAKQGAMTITFPDLTSGEFAVVAIHDENGNYDLDFNGLTPTEGVGVSNAFGSLDNPGFDRAKVKAGPVDVTVHYY